MLGVVSILFLSSLVRATPEPSGQEKEKIITKDVHVDFGGLVQEFDLKYSQSFANAPPIRQVSLNPYESTYQTPSCQEIHRNARAARNINAPPISVNNDNFNHFIIEGWA